MTFRQRFFASPLRAVTNSPEFNVAVFALLLNFPWEILQMRLFAGVASVRFVDAISGCTQATLGDVIIMLLAFETVALAARNRRWVLAPSGRQLAVFIGIGVSITAIIEWLATNGRWVQGWTYSLAMPVLPVVGIGVSPLLQWVFVPLLLVWFVRRQLAAPIGGS
jgi:hypothetical protein